MALMLLFLLVFAMIGFVILGIFPDTWAMLGERLLGQGYFGWHVSHGPSPRLSQQLGSFFYTLDGTMVLFGVLALLGLFMAGFSLVKVGEFPRPRPALDSLHQMFGLCQERTRSAAGFLAASLFKFIPARRGLTWKLGGPLAAVLLLIGLLILGTVYQLMATVIQEQVKTRAIETVRDMSEGAASHLAKKDPVALHALLVQYARLDGVAYVFVDDGQGRVIADRLGRFPTELQEMSMTDAFRTAGWRSVSVRGEAIYDVRVPIVDDATGAAAHMGIRKESVDRQIHAALFPAVTLIAIIVVGGIVLVFVFVSHLTRPFLQLVEVARQMSDGHLDTPPTVNARDEVGDLALSLERMRSSLKAVMRRLDRHPPSP